MNKKKTDGKIPNQSFGGKRFLAGKGAALMKAKH
jgi:hypothetical protein